MNRTGILGGSFDPVHKAHISMAQTALKEFALDKVIFVPAYRPPHKMFLSSPPQDRYNMLSLAIKNFEKFFIDTYELDLKREVFSYQMLDYFKDKYKDTDIKMIIGSDSFNNLALWKNAEYICKNYGFYVIKRPNIEINKNSIYYKYCIFSESVMADISSTEIREKIKNGQDITALVLPETAEYIKEKKLYLGS